ncbi:phospholipase D-like domain-containing protein [Paracidovorax avenae]|uniref:phospholipase D-like domain-containing protein n=1 Tax=Paracidovorax avenae TaxID=80867 RepID=UPI000D222E8A|nr:phospholipase D-like domain-containing protein [Paracidovorax avenae]AVT05052.1 phospholipase [Paracidovorax avenae]
MNSPSVNAKPSELVCEAPSYDLVPRSLVQLYDAATNDPMAAFGTSSIDMLWGEQFSDPVGGNTVTHLTSGKAYFAELMGTVRAAKTEVLIAGWQINWDALLAPGVRLYDLLREVALKPNAPKIYVMPWDNPSQVETYAKQTEKVLSDINSELKAPRIFVHRSATLSDQDNLFFSHHQKLVAIDRQIAFIGGIDLAYGRYDDEYYQLLADADGRDGLNRYNSCIPAIGKVSHPVIDPDLLVGAWDNVVGNASHTRVEIQKGGLQGASGKHPDVSLDPTRQPRMPWQDLQQKIEGPAAANVALNFVLRWNAGASEKIKHVPALVTLPAPGKSGCSVQVLRSASARLRKAEYLALDSAQRKVALPHGAPNGCQNDIERAMLNLIDQAQHYIYIENQFFTSGFGDARPDQNTDLSGPALLVKDDNSLKISATRVMPGDADGPIENTICRALGARLSRAITAGIPEPFHVYIVLPVHPEGHLNDGPTMTQIHWTMQSLVFGQFSLLNQVKAALASVDRPQDDWTQYLTLLNLRNWALLEGMNGKKSVVTEQIYVHTKLMIVDDRYVLHGSANINDRSQLGKRDSEIAVLIHDSQEAHADLCGTGQQVLVLRHAQSLRKAVWRKIFGLEQRKCLIAGGAGPASELESILEKPAASVTVKAIQRIAESNQKIYESTFDWIPRNSVLAPALAPSIWPRWKETNSPGEQTEGKLIAPMPFDDEFWQSIEVEANAADKLNGIKGFITALPITWTMYENNNLGYHIRLVAINDRPLPVLKNEDASLDGLQMQAQAAPQVKTDAGAQT